MLTGDMSYADNPHKNGRPRRSDQPTTTLSIRLTHDELDAVTAHANSRGVPRVALIRAALARCKLFDVDADVSLRVRTSD